MRPGWYILNYHSVDWEDSLLTRGLGTTTRPDVFRHHMQAVARRGRIVSIAEGQRLLESGEPIGEPLFSIWFDDGFAGLVDFALPVCAEFGAVPALSICSRFVLRQELFWRAKLAYLIHTDGLRLLRARLRQSLGTVPFRLRGWTLQSFGPELLEILDQVYEEHSSAAFREDALRLFADEHRIRLLADAGWTITNHTAAHWALSEGLGWDVVKQQFEECEELVRRFNPANRYWVLPFAFGSATYRDQLMKRATVVEVGERFNTAQTWRETAGLFRFDASSTRDPLPL